MTRLFLSGWLILHKRGGGGGVRGRKTICDSKIDLQVQAPLMNFTVFLRTKFLIPPPPGPKPPDIPRPSSPAHRLHCSGALTSYTFQLASFLLLRWHKPDLPRPYRSPFGVPGACAALLLVWGVLGCIAVLGYYRPHYLHAFLGLAVVILGAVGGFGVQRCMRRRNPEPPLVSI